MSLDFSSFLPSSTDRVPYTSTNFLRQVLPAFIGYYILAVLVLLPNTIFIRRSLLPVCLWLTIRGAVTVDLAVGHPLLNYMNYGHMVAMISVGMRSIEWALLRRTLTRNPTADQPHPTSTSPTSIAYDALSLMFGLRGIGWKWSKGLYIPKQTRPTSTLPFLKSTLASGLWHFTLLDCMQYAAQTVLPAINTAQGASIFDPNLPPLPRFGLASLLSLAAGLIVYAGIQTMYDIATLIGIIICRHDVSEWPRLFDAPWTATSLVQFWSKGWHQLFRSSFIYLGFKPFHAVFGRIGGIFGAFLISAILHDWGMWGLGRGMDFWRVGGFFLMMAVGIIAEGLWEATTKKRVGGFVGWVWTVLWVVLWGTMMVDSWARRGMVASTFVPDGWRPVEMILAITGL
ncbi:hypothetical protein JAAARDRAFT_194185 [Jaapia argillacea MUCL 33604]|uniref:Wax synthase domain-containing protein n=1 Tax=Jaapia argillacea MUCL 33604 TaxID=933084 RepID=A0A067Q335_9AGAM|nr:hypothetical protein JAAARDRAFT_194185 [Jaapia argillacea MUCL 33604]